MPACLVLGETGFIGGHIARAALERGWRTRGLRRRPQAVGHVQDAPIEWANGDLTDPASISAAMHGVDVIFHAAAYYPKRSRPEEVPAQITYARQEIDTVLDAARKAGARRFIFTSTLTTIGRPPDGNNRLADERDFYIPGTLAKSGYYEAKFAMEARVLQAARSGFPAVILNPTAVFGPGDVHGTMGRLLLAVARGWGIAWLPVEVNVVDVRDVAAGHLAAAEKGNIGDRYILGGDNTNLRDVLNIVARVARVHPPRFEIPLHVIDWIVALGDALPSLTTGNHLRAARYWQGYNSEKARRMLGFSSRPFEQTAGEALEWINKNSPYD
jgi:dihydroflavonol-4-reductase